MAQSGRVRRPPAVRWRQGLRVAGSRSGAAAKPGEMAVARRITDSGAAAESRRRLKRAGRAARCNLDETLMAAGRRGAE